MPENNIVMLDT